MLSAFLPIGFLIAFAGWILYRLLIKRDLRNHLSSLYAGIFFTGIWILLYFLMLKP
jgi:hypothetical protein